jgi:hypothetical protein
MAFVNRSVRAQEPVGSKYSNALMGMVYWDRVEAKHHRRRSEACRRQPLTLGREIIQDLNENHSLRRKNIEHTLDNPIHDEGGAPIGLPNRFLPGKVATRTNLMLSRASGGMDGTTTPTDIRS